MLLEDAKTDGFCDVQNRWVRHSASNRGSQHDYRRDVFGPLARHGTSNHSSQAVSDEMNSATGLSPGLFDGAVETSLDQKIRTLGIDTDTGEVGPISDAVKPSMEFGEIQVRPQKSGDDYNR